MTSDGTVLVQRKEVMKSPTIILDLPYRRLVTGRWGKLTFEEVLYQEQTKLGRRSTVVPTVGLFIEDLFTTQTKSVVRFPDISLAVYM